MADDALVEFCRLQYPRLVGFLGLYCGNRAVAEELAQETLARMETTVPAVKALLHRAVRRLRNEGEVVDPKEVPDVV